MVTVELGNGRGLENGLLSSSVMERPDTEQIGALHYIETHSTRLETSSMIVFL